VPLTIGTAGTGDEPTQLHQIAEKVEARLRRAQEDTAQATQDLTQVQSALVEQQSKAKWENLALQAKWDEEKSQLQQSKDHLLAEQLEVQERVHKALHSMTVIEVKIEECVPQQVAQLEEVIQNFSSTSQIWNCTVPKTPQEIRDLREATPHSTVGQLKTFSLECK
jgi:chromosome segregation ATPase